MTTSQASGDLPDAAPTDAEVTMLRAENDALRSRLTARARWRRWLSIVLVFLTVLSVVATTVAVWAHETVFDTDRFMETVQPALDDPALYDAMSERVSDEIVLALDVETRVAAILTGVDEYLSQTLLDAIDVSERGQAILDRVERPSLALLAVPIADAVNTRIAETVDAFITSDGFKARLPELVRQAHIASVSLVRNDLAELPNVYVENGAVRLNLTPIITDALRRVAAEVGDFLPNLTLPDAISNRVDEGRQQLADAVEAELPEDFGQVSLFSEQNLTDVQDVARRLDRLVWALVLLTIILAVATVAFSPTRRRTTIQVTLGTIGGLAIGVVAVRRLESAILEQITNPNGLAAGRALLAEVIGSLRSVALAVVLIAALVALVAYLSGQPAWLTKVSAGWKRAVAPSPEGSDLDRWVSAHHDLLRLAGVAVAVVVLFGWGLTLISVIVIAGVLALYLWALASAQHRTSSGHAPGEPDVKATS